MRPKVGIGGDHPRQSRPGFDPKDFLATVSRGRSVTRYAKDAIVYRSVDDNIEYKVTVVDFTPRAGEGAVLLGEATYMFQDKKKLLMDTFGRVDGMYGRKLSVEQPNNGGRTLGAFYFINGRLISLQVTVLPANGDYGTPDMGRFVDSLAFRPDRAEKGATELGLPR